MYAFLLISLFAWQSPVNGSERTSSCGYITASLLVNLEISTETALKAHYDKISYLEMHRSRNSI